MQCHLPPSHRGCMARTCNRGARTLRRAKQETCSTCSVECGTYYDVSIKQWECTYLWWIEVILWCTVHDCSRSYMKWWGQPMYTAYICRSRRPKKVLLYLVVTVHTVHIRVLNRRQTHQYIPPLFLKIHLHQERNHFRKFHIYFFSHNFLWIVTYLCTTITLFTRVQKSHNYVACHL